MTNLKDFDIEESLNNKEFSNTIYIIIASTYSEGSPPEDAQWFCKWLEDSVNDFRVSKTLLQEFQYAVFGLGNSLYQDHYNLVGHNIDLWLNKLGAERYAPLGLGDENTVNSLNGSIEADFDHWSEGVLHLLKGGQSKTKKTGCGSGNECCSKKDKKKKVFPTGRKAAEAVSNITAESDSDAEEAVMDLEDLGSFIRIEKRDEVQEVSADEENIDDTDGQVREMLTPLLRESLTKQGYKLIGTHSGVKLCRWTKVTNLMDVSFLLLILSPS